MSSLLLQKVLFEQDFSLCSKIAELLKHVEAAWLSESEYTYSVYNLG